MQRNGEDIALIVDSCIEPIVKGEETLEAVLERYPDQALELRPSLEAALWLGNYRNTISVNEEFIQASRRRIVNRIKARPVNDAAASWSFRDFLSGLLVKRKFAFQLAFAIILIFSLVLGNNSLALAAQQTIPGDAIYPVKIAQEKIWVFFSFTPENAARFQINFVEQRLQEIEGVLLDASYEFVPAAVDRYESQYYQAIGSLSLVAIRNRRVALQLTQQLSTIITRETHVLEVLAKAVPPDIQALLNRVFVFSNFGVVTLQSIGSTISGISPYETTPAPPAIPSATAAASSTPNLPTPTATADVSLVKTEHALLSATPPVTDTPVPIMSATLTATAAPWDTAVPVPTQEQTTKPKATQATRTPQPTQVVDPTRTPKPTTATPLPTDEPPYPPP